MKSSFSHWVANIRPHFPRHFRHLFLPRKTTSTHFIRFIYAALRKKKNSFKKIYKKTLRWIFSENICDAEKISRNAHNWAFAVYFSFSLCWTLLRTMKVGGILKRKTATDNAILLVVCFYDGTYHRGRIRITIRQEIVKQRTRAMMRHSNTPRRSKKRGKDWIEDWITLGLCELTGRERRRLSGVKETWF